MKKEAQNKVEPDTCCFHGVIIPSGAEELKFWETRNFGWVSYKIDGKTKLIQL